MKCIRTRPAIGICLFLFLLGTFGFSQEMPYRNLEADIQKALADFQVPGLAIGIVKDGIPVYIKGFGIKNIHAKDPVDENTIFGIGSATKTFTAGLAAVLVQEGKIQWDDKVVQHLPDFQLYDPWVTKETTIRDLLSHRTGVAEANNLGLLFIGSNFSRDSVVAKARFLIPVIGFRTGWFYNNIMFITAGQLMAGATGKSWDTNIREMIFEPLGMKASCTSIRSFKPSDNIVTPHWYEDGHPVPIPWGNMDTAGPAGAINSSVADLVKWLQVHLNGGTLSGKTLWSADIQGEMFSPHSLLVNIPLGWQTQFSTYGLGWFISEYRGNSVVWHAGNCDGMSSIIGMLPQKKLGVVILQNTFPTRFELDLMLRIMDSYLGLPEKDWRPLGSPSPISMSLPKYSQAPDEKPIAPESAQQFVGTYSSELFGKVDVRFERGKMVLRFEAYPRADLHMKGENAFVADFGDGVNGMFGLILGGRVAEVQFVPDDGGQMKEIRIGKFGAFKKLN
ncbi:MAG: serine hydrolase domain-containing protein [Candidatus Aminicenantales bacterium]